MTSNSTMMWANGLIPIIEKDVTAQIISRVCDIALIVDPSGKILTAKANKELAKATHVSAWDGAQIQQTLTIESVPKFESRIAQFLDGNPDVLPVELNHQAASGFAELPVKYTFHTIGHENTILMLGSDLRQTAEMQQQLVATQIALEADYEAQREHDIRVRVLMEATDVPTVFLSASTGQIVACNTAAEGIFGKPKDELIGLPFADEFEAKGRKDVVDRMITAATEQPRTPVLAKSAKGNRKLSLEPTLFRGATSQMILCKMASAGTQSASGDVVHKHLGDLFQNGVDSFVFVSASGHIISANEAFLKLANITHSQSVKGRSMADFFTRGPVDLNVMIENARRSGHMRLYATKIRSEHGSERAIEVSTTLLNAGSDPIFAMVIRDSHRVETHNASMKQVTDVDMASVIELIGGQSLKDIVAKTTDVVEKMCIETAVEMTSNNRVAAAEMLGLSRQSLYVKLRKYGLISKG